MYANGWGDDDMRRALFLLIAGAALSGLAAYAASANVDRGAPGYANGMTR